jgi:hypothetical protein
VIIKFIASKKKGASLPAPFRSLGLKVNHPTLDLFTVEKLLALRE